MAQTDRIPNGIFKSALTKGGRHMLFRDAPFMTAFWAVIMFVPWEAIGEGNGAMPWGIKAYQKFAAEGIDGFPWGAAIVTGFFALIVFSLASAGLRAMSKPHKMREVKLLKSYGSLKDQVEEFEFEAAKFPLLQWKEPELIGTANWVMVRHRDTVLLIPIQKIIWAYDRGDRMGGAMSFGLGQIGMISRRQQKIEKMLGDRVFEFWLEDQRDPIAITLPGFGVDKATLVNHLLEWNKDMIWGFAPELDKLFHKDRVTFKEKAMEQLKLGVAPQGDIFETLGSALDISENISDAANIFDKK